MASFGSVDVINAVCDAAFGRPLITNVLRGLVVEGIVALALDDSWRWCSADYASWDFESAAGVRLEVKQSAYRQSWKTPISARISPGFDVKPRKHRLEGTTYVLEPGRAAHIYILAYHDVRDDTADHRDPTQWEFYVIRAVDLPPYARIGLSNVRRLCDSVSVDRLADRVRNVIAILPPRRTDPPVE